MRGGGPLVPLLQERTASATRAHRCPESPRQSCAETMDVLHQKDGSKIPSRSIFFHNIPILCLQQPFREHHAASLISRCSLKGSRHPRRFWETCTVTGPCVETCEGKGILNMLVEHFFGHRYKYGWYDDYSSTSWSLSLS